MPEKELLKQFNVSLCEFDSSQWSRDGFLDPVNRVVYINKDLAPEIRLKVLLHELGHLETILNTMSVCEKSMRFKLIEI